MHKCILIKIFNKLIERTLQIRCATNLAAIFAMFIVCVFCGANRKKQKVVAKFLPISYYKVHNVMVILCAIVSVTYPASVKHLYVTQKMVGNSISVLQKAQLPHRTYI